MGGALKNNTAGRHLVAVGNSALFNQIENDVQCFYKNTAIGAKSLYSNTKGYRNTATCIAGMGATTPVASSLPEIRSTAKVLAEK